MVWNALRYHLPCQFHHLRRNDEIERDIAACVCYNCISKYDIEKS